MKALTERQPYASLTAAGVNVTDQLPLGDFSPGRWALLLDDIAPTTDRCPACWGDGFRQVDGVTVRCRVCGSGWVNVNPVPARGRSGLGEWTP